MPYDERDVAFLDAINRCRTKLMVSYLPESGRVVRIVSSDFTAIPHSLVLRTVREILKGDYEQEDIETNGGMFAKWTLRSLPKECAKLGEVVSWNLWVYNRNDGRHGLRVGGGFTVLACQNGAIRWKSARIVRIVHRGEIEDIRSKLEEAVYQIVHDDLPLMAYGIQVAREIKYDREKVEKMVRLFPQWIQRRLWEQLKRARTWWDVSNAFSWVATHEPVTFNQRIQLSNLAVEALQVAGRR
jgi:hypothetical protein